MKKLLYITHTLCLLFLSLNGMKENCPTEKKLESFFTQWQIGKHTEFKGYPFNTGYTNDELYTKALVQHIENNVEATLSLKSFYLLDYKKRCGAKFDNEVSKKFENSVKFLARLIQIYTCMYPLPIISDYLYTMGDISKTTYKILSQESSKRNIATHLIDTYLVEKKLPNTYLLMIAKSIQKNNIEPVENDIIDFKDMLDDILEKKIIKKEEKTISKAKNNSLPLSPFLKKKISMLPKKFSFNEKKSSNNVSAFTKLLFESDESDESDDKNENNESLFESDNENDENHKENIDNSITNEESTYDWSDLPQKKSNNQVTKDNLVIKKIDLDSKKLDKTNI